jgi:hypothetical protein
VSIKELKLIGMKSHDYHVLLTQLLLVAIRGILKPPVRHTITKLCFFFNGISSKAIDVRTLDKLQSDVVKTLYEFEMHFPPSFFRYNGAFNCSFGTGDKNVWTNIFEIHVPF